MTTQQMIDVVGAGTMGNGIAQVSALAGLSVVMLDLDEKRAARDRKSGRGFYLHA
jgi:3-hydroxybutyryl-CoA dehydrogenase